MVTVQMIELESPFAELMTKLVETADEELRLIFRYNSDTVDITFLRDDLLGEDIIPRVDELHSRSKIIETSPIEDTEANYGEFEANISVYEDAFVLQFIGQGGEGMVAVTERNGGDLIKEVL